MFRDFWRQLSIQNKILLPFFLIFTVAVGIGVWRVSNLMEDKMEHLTSDFLDRLHVVVKDLFLQQSKKVVYYSRVLAEAKRLTQKDQNSSLSTQNKLLQTLKEENILVYKITSLKEVKASDPFYALIKHASSNIQYVGFIDKSFQNEIVYFDIASADLVDDEPKNVVVVGTRLDNNFLEFIKKKIRAELVIFDKRGVLRASTLTELTPTLLPQDLEEVIKWGRTIKTSFLLKNEDYRGIYFPLTVEESNQGVILLTISAKDLVTAKKSILQQSFYFFSFILILMMIIYYFIIRGISSYLRYLVQATKKVADGDLDQFIIIDRHDEIGELAKAFTQMEDKLKLYQSKMVQAEKLAGIGQLAAGIAHEINNPLCGVSNYCQILQGKFTEEDPRIKYVKQIQSGLNYINIIVSKLLAFSRPNKLNLVKSDLPKLIDETLSLLQFQLDQNSIRLKKTYSHDLPLLKVDPSQMKQVFMNLTLNAIEAMPEKGIISIRANYIKISNLVRVEFEDTGEGIPPDKIAKIFDPFFTTKEVGRGTGLGLFVSYGILKQHGGYIEVESTVGKGTKFIIILPLGGESDKEF